MVYLHIKDQNKIIEKNEFEYIVKKDKNDKRNNKKTNYDDLDNDNDENDNYNDVLIILYSQ